MTQDAVKPKSEEDLITKAYRTAWFVKLHDDNVLFVTDMDKYYKIYKQLRKGFARLDVADLFLKIIKKEKRGEGQLSIIINYEEDEQIHQDELTYKGNFTICWRGKNRKSIGVW